MAEPAPGPASQPVRGHGRGGGRGRGRGHGRGRGRGRGRGGGHGAAQQVGQEGGQEAGQQAGQQQPVGGGGRRGRPREQCVICFDYNIPKHTQHLLLPCKHRQQHSQCYNVWRAGHSYCPSCREPVQRDVKYTVWLQEKMAEIEASTY